MTGENHKPVVDSKKRDLAILRGLFESRVMKLAHVAVLYFEGRNEAAKKRIQKLRARGLVRERPRSVRDPSILFLTSAGLTYLHDEHVLGDYPYFSRAYLESRAQVADSTLAHELQVMDVKCAYATAIAGRSNLKLVEFCTWPILKEFRARQPEGDVVTVRPDGFFRIIETEATGERCDQSFFLELDRGTKVRDTLAIHAFSYRDYYQRGAFAERCGGKVEQPEKFPFRVLFVLQTAEQRNNAAERMLMLREPVGEHSWLSTREEVLRDPLGEIWVTPREYYRVTKDTAFSIERRGNLAGYPRNSQRDDLIQRSLTKRSIL
jgi:hypothetical protein